MHFLCVSYDNLQVKECREFICGDDGYTRRCYTKYHTKCSTKLVYRNMLEDRPVCGVQKQPRCTAASRDATDSKGREDGGCKMVPVMKCKIEKKTVRDVWIFLRYKHTLYKQMS